MKICASYFLMLALLLSSVFGCKKEKLKIKPVGKYVKGILLISNTNAKGDSADISYLDEKEKLTQNVFSLENNGKKLPLNTMSAFRYSNQLYVTSSNAPNIQVIDDETLKLANISISNSSIRSISYFATTDGKTGYVVGGTGSKRGLYAVDLNAKTIAGTLLTGTASAALIPMTTYNNAYITPVLKKLVSIKDGTLQTLFTYPENVAGIVKASNKQIWMGISKGGSTNAKMVRLNENLEVQETIDLGTDLLLPQNGELITSGANEYIYWQETSTGKFYRFNTTTKKEELFVYPTEDGAGFITAWKVNPRTGEMYIIDSKSTSDNLPSDLLIYGVDKKLRKKIANVGYQVKDVVFPK